MVARRLSLLFAVFACVVSAPARADLESFSTAGTAVSYDMEFFSFDGPLRGAAASHSFVRLRKIENGRLTEVVDISWLPAPDFFRRRGRVPFFRTVPGRNYSLEETFGMAAANGRPVLSHGRFEAAEELFEAAKRRRNELESGGIAYKMIDNATFPAASNCIHAISGMFTYLRTGLKRGRTATNSLVGFFLGTGLLWSPGQRPVPPSETPAPLARNPAPPDAPVPPPSQAPIPTIQAPPTHGGFVPVAQAPVRRRPIVGLFRRR
jgi:hypothetical protein